MEALPIFDQPWAEWLGEVYVAITPENMKEMVCRINDHPDNPERELSDYEAMKLCDQPWMPTMMKTQPIIKTYRIINP